MNETVTPKKRAQSPRRKKAADVVETHAEVRAAALGKREHQAIDPSSMTLNHEGFGWREWLVRLPDGLIADSLKEPSLWRKVQKHRVALRRHDRLYMTAFDESWVAEAIVVDGDAHAATISKPRLTSFESRTRRLWEDDTYRVRWYGDGYAVERKADGHQMTRKVASEALAERELAGLYPRQV